MVRVDLTLVHEDIYVYVDEMVTKKVIKIGKDFSFTNDSLEGIADLGLFEIEITQGNFTGMIISFADQSLTINLPLVIGDKVTLDFRTNTFKKNGTRFYTDNILVLEGNSYTTINVSFLGTGQSEVTYSYNRYEEQSDDLMFVDSISAEENIEYQSRTNIKNKQQYIKGSKKTYSFSISTLWTEEQETVIPDEFRLRLTDEDGNNLEILAGCRVTSKRKGSSSNGGDYTFEISGSCEKIY